MWRPLSTSATGVEGRKGVDQWVGRNEFLYGKTKEERLAKTTQEVDSQIWHMHRADRKQVCPSDKHLFEMSAEQRINNPLTESNNGLNVSQLRMRLGQHSGILKAHHKDIASLWNQASGRQPQVRLWPE